MALQLRVYVPPHPLIKHWLGVARDAATPSVLFRTAMTELGRWLTYEAIREWLPTLETQVDLTCGEQKVATGKYKLNVRRGDDKDAWSVVLVPHELTRAESGVRSARRNGEDAVTEAQAALETVRADLKAKGTASETVLTIAKFEAGNAEHLGVIGIHHGYDTVQRGSEEPASGMHCSLRVSFGDLHRELDLHEVFTPPAKR